jgi:hypothetical protein
MKTTACILLLGLLLAGSLYGQKVGTTSLQFLKVMPTARATGMGDAYVAVSTGADATFWNPAALTTAVTHEFSTTMTIWMFDTRQSAIGYALPLADFGVIGVQLQYVDYGDIAETRVDHLMFTGPTGAQTYNPGLTGREFSPKSYLLGLSYARQLTQRFSAGISAKYVVESLWDESSVVVRIPGEGGMYTEETYSTRAQVLLFDFGMRYLTGYRSVRIGASVQNFGSQVRFAKEQYNAPLVFRLGAAAEVMGTDALLIPDDVSRVTVAYDIIQPNDYLQQMHVGAEYSFRELFALRAGYRFNYDADGLTLGGGLRADLAGFAFSFDYSYGTMGEYLPNVHRISLGAQLK